MMTLNQLLIMFGPPVPRMILKEHYQGDIEDDESEATLGEDSDSFEMDDLSDSFHETSPTTKSHKAADNIFQASSPRNSTWPDLRKGGFFGNLPK
jgi:hypothetical protein